jgi:hypothetical protein
MFFSWENNDIPRLVHGPSHNLPAFYLHQFICYPRQPCATYIILSPQMMKGTERLHYSRSQIAEVGFSPHNGTFLPSTVLSFTQGRPSKSWSLSNQPQPPSSQDKGPSSQKLLSYPWPLGNSAGAVFAPDALARTVKVWPCHATWGVNTDSYWGLASQSFLCYVPRTVHPS